MAVVMGITANCDILKPSLFLKNFLKERGGWFLCLNMALLKV